MKFKSSSTITLVVLITAVFAYFVAFPEDARAVTAPIARVLGLTQAISFGLYMVVAVAIIAWTIVKVWGRKSELR